MQRSHIQMVRKAKLMKQETFECEIRLQDDPDRASPGRLTGILMPYLTRASDRNELFELNSLSWPDDGVLVRRMHQRGAPIVKAVPFVEGSALRIDAALPNSTAGRDAAEELRSGILQGLSVEFTSVKETRRNGMRIIQKAILGGAGLVDVASYQGAKAELRAKSDIQRRIARLWL